ncbi:MAG: hypothetical protein HOV76_32415 [Hamadaea sp.]|nr:hypothetical protein [Hamadaea sp.]
MTVTVAPTVELSNVPPRVRLDVSASAGETSTTVVRNDPDNVQRPVRTSDGAPLTLSGGVGLLYDYEVPYSTVVTYTTLESPTVLGVDVTVDVDQVWLIHPGVPGLSMPVNVASIGTRTRSVQQGVHWPMGRKTPVVQTDGQRKAPSGQIELRVESLEELADLEALTDDAGTLFLNIPADFGWGVSACYISVGDIQEDRLVEYAGEPRRYYQLPFQVVDQPVGGTQAQRQYTDVLATFTSYTTMKAAYTNYLSLLAGP